MATQAVSQTARGLRVVPGTKSDVIRQDTGVVPGQKPNQGDLSSNPDFRGLPREFQRAVESGSTSLDAAVADAKRREVFGRYNGEGDPAGGGGVGTPGGGSAGGGGGGGGGTGSSTVTDTGFNVGQSQGENLDVDATVRKWFTGILDGSIGSFTKEKEALMIADITEAANRKKAALKQADQARSVGRGLFRSGIALQSEREIDLAMEQEKSSGIRQVKLARLEAEFNDKMQALDLAQKWLDSKRNYELGKERLQAQREATRAQIALGYAQIAASKENARMSAGAARASLALSRERFEFEKEQAVLDREDRRMTQLFNMAGGL